MGRRGGSAAARVRLGGLACRHVRRRHDGPARVYGARSIRSQLTVRHDGKRYNVYGEPVTAGGGVCVAAAGEGDQGRVTEATW